MKPWVKNTNKIGKLKTTEIILPRFMGVTKNNWFWIERLDLLITAL
jgi:hypothetical protein